MKPRAGRRRRRPRQKKTVSACVSEHERADENMSADMSDAENMIIGALSSFGTVGLLQPTLYLKNARAQGLAPSFDPRGLYRGVGVNLANEMGQLSLQFGVTGFFKRLFPATPSGELTAAASAGGLVAFYASPCELIMIQQQRHGDSFFRTARHVISRYGLVFSLSRGLSLSIARDAIFVGGMLGATPVFYTMLVDRMTARTSGDEAFGKGIGKDSTGSPDAASKAQTAAASLLASMMGGVLGSVLSHPFDVVNTCLKGDLDKSTYGGVRDTFRRLYREGGFARLMNGSVWRGINVTATCWIANECNIRLPTYVSPVTRGWLGWQGPPDRTRKAVEEEATCA